MNISCNNPISHIEMQEIIDKLKDSGYKDYVECLIENDNDCYTKKGRLNKSGACRKMGIKNKQLEDALVEMREILKNDFDLDDIVINDDEEVED